MLPITPRTKVVYDPATQAIRSWFDTTTIETANKDQLPPRNFALETLRTSAAQFSWQPALNDLKYRTVLTNGNALSVRFTQDFKGIPVDASEVVVNILPDTGVYSINNHYHYDIPEELDPKKVKLQAKDARDIVSRLLKSFKEHRFHEPELIVYQLHQQDRQAPKGGTLLPFMQELLSQLTQVSEDGAVVKKEGKYFLAWDLVVSTSNPTANIRFLIDATNGMPINIIDLSQYISASGRVFDPNPVVTSGNTGLHWTTADATLNGQAIPVTLDRLNAADAAGNLHLDGSLVQMEEFENPVVAEPTSSLGDFIFSIRDTSFLDAMAYYHIDRFQNYIQTVLGINNAANFSIGVDPQGLEGGGDNSHYLPADKKIAFGVRNPNSGIVYNPIPDAADAMVILHEYGHAIQDNILPGFEGRPGGVGEGFGDFLAAVFFDDKHAVPANTRGIQMSFDANTTDAGWGGRSYAKATLFDDTAFINGGFYGRAEVWASTMFEIYRKLGGDSGYTSVKSSARDLIIRLHLMATYHVPVTGSTVTDWGNQVFAMDSSLGGWRYPQGLHKKVIYDTYQRRHLSGFPVLPIDVYINDGRNGGYGSNSGNDLFTEKLFPDNYWSTQDLWVTVAPYASDADQQAGGPGDHVEPPVGSLAYLFVKVKNKGATASGAVTLKAYHSDPTIGLVWPADWTPNDTPSLTEPNIPAGGTHIFGPFPWTPSHVGHECVFAIAECDGDHAVTQDLLSTDLVAHADLVPFDNNIGQRNLYPTAAQGKMIRGFYVSNPLFEQSVVQLHFESTLPKGWTYHTNLATTEAIHLAPRERKWVEVLIDQANGAEITDFTNPPALVVSGTIGGKLIGGMGFYAAPPSAFPAAPSKPSKPSECCAITKPEDLFCVNVPWKDCDFEGELELKIRFRSKK